MTTLASEASWQAANACLDTFGGYGFVNEYDVERKFRQLVAAVGAELPAGSPFTVALDATHLPRTPSWMRGIHRAQRWVGLSALLPRSASGDSRAVPLRWLPACSPKAQPVAGYEPMTEWAAGRDQLHWLRQTLDAQGAQDQSILAVADGAYASAALWRELPERTILLARCAKNRALWALPGTQPPRGRRRLYGERLPTPEQYHAQDRGFGRVRVMVRGRRVKVQVKVVGPLLVRPAADRPLFLLVVKGYSPKQQGQRI